MAQLLWKLFWQFLKESENGHVPQQHNSQVYPQDQQKPMSLQRLVPEHSRQHYDRPKGGTTHTSVR